MKQLFLLVLIFLVSCTSETPQPVDAPNDESNTPFISAEFEVYKSSTQKALLILFPCYPCHARSTAQEFKIVNEALDNGVSLLMMNFNKHLYLEEKEKFDLAKMINLAISEHQLDTTNVFIGGFSSGGNVSLLLSNYLIQTKNIIQPKGVFIADSPVDLLALYKVSEKNIKSNNSVASVAESKWITELLSQSFGDPKDDIKLFEKYSPFTAQTNNISNLEFLKNTSLRFYAEPDYKWWKENRNNEPEETNAFSIEQCATQLSNKFGNELTTYIATKNRGYRANGVRHPHSWSIVDEKGLVKWIETLSAN